MWTDAEVARLEGLGAERVQQVQTWWVMRDLPPASRLPVAVPLGRLPNEVRGRDALLAELHRPFSRSLLRWPRKAGMPRRR